MRENCESDFGTCKLFGCVKSERNDVYNKDSGSCNNLWLSNEIRLFFISVTFK